MNKPTFEDLLNKHFPKPKPETKVDKRRAVEDIKLAKSLGISVLDIK